MAMGKPGLALPRHALVHDRPRKPNWFVRRLMRNRAQPARMYFTTTSPTNVVLFNQRLITRFVRLPEIVEERTARRDELQQAAARVIVLYVALEMLCQVVDAFRQDRDLNFRGAGVAGLHGTSLDDFRFALGG